MKINKQPDIVIDYHRRPIQKTIHHALESHRFCVIVAHRRLGKTVCVVNHLIKQALLKPDGLFAYIAPFRNQAKAIAWGYVKNYTRKIERRKINETELSITLPNNSVIRLFGADNPDALRGLGFDGVALDEVAQMKPELWDEIIQPALIDKHGWAVFIGTVKGHNLFSQLYFDAIAAMNVAKSANQPSDWFAGVYRADETRILPDKELEAIRLNMSEAAFNREFLCDFNAAVDDVLINVDEVEQASRREISYHDVFYAPLVLGVDVARFGDDASCISARQGLLAYEPIVMRGFNNMEVVDRVSSLVNQFAKEGKVVSAVFIDAGRGEGVIDCLRALGFSGIIEVPFGALAADADRFVNKRSEMWYAMAQWIKSGGKINNNLQLKSELAGTTYSYDSRGRLQLEAKEKMKQRIGKSPDLADSLALTFAYTLGSTVPVALRQQANTSYDPWSSLEKGLLEGSSL